MEKRRDPKSCRAAHRSGHPKSETRKAAALKTAALHSNLKRPFLPARYPRFRWTQIDNEWQACRTQGPQDWNVAPRSSARHTRVRKIET